MAVEEDEYELVPLSPLRKMDKRLEKLERGGTSDEMVKELIDVVRTNQQIVDDVVKINSDIVNKVTELTGSVNQMLSKMDEFLSRVEVGAAAEESAPGAPAAAETGRVEDRLDKLEKRINALVLSAVAKGRLRPMQKRPA